MGVLTDIYISTPDDALVYDSEPRRFDGCSLSAKGVMDLELSTLWCIYTGEQWDVKILDRFKQLMSADGGERTIFELPDELISLLANTDERRLAEVLPKWAATEEIDVEPSELEPYLRDLIALAKRASADGNRLYLWVCV
jgi:hypothetical protein